MSWGDNKAGLYDDARALLEQAEKAAATYFRIANSDDYKRGDQSVALLRFEEHKAEADTLRRLIEYAFAA